MLDIPSISAVVAATSVIVGVVLAVLELRNLVKTRQTDMVIRLYSAYGTKEYQEAREKVFAREYKNYNDYLKNYGFLEVAQVGLLFEEIGVLLHRKLIDIELIDDLFSSPIKMTWEIIEPLVKERRKRFKRPQIWEYFEYLYNEMKKREQRLEQTQQ